jgi:hypothetical protein
MEQNIRGLAEHASVAARVAYRGGGNADLLVQNGRHAHAKPGLAQAHALSSSTGWQAKDALAYCVDEALQVSYCRLAEDASHHVIAERRNNVAIEHTKRLPHGCEAAMETRPAFHH